MPSQIVDCPDVVGKTVKSFKLYPADSGGAEIVVEFTDGTSLVSTFESCIALKASLIRTGIAAPQMLKAYSD
jgi:hypothetical protein